MKLDNVNPLRVLLKALLLYVIANLAFAYFQPPVGKLSIYNWLVSGRERMPYEREIEYYPVSHTMPVYEDMDAMFSSHIVSRPKQADEYRVMLVGDSSTWAFGLTPEENLTAQLNLLDLKTCDGKRVVFYNIAFPLPYVAKDVLIMEKAREYQPDMFLWLVTLDAFRNRTIYTDYFLSPYSEEVLSLVDTYQLTNLDVENVTPPTFWDQTIIGQRGRLKKIALLQLHGLPWNATKLDYYYRTWSPLSQDQSDSLESDFGNPESLNFDKNLFDVLRAGQGVAGDLPLLLVNEPIFIAYGANSEIRYNDFYPRWVYDEYRIYLDKITRSEKMNYLDLWNVVPSSEFTDSPFHRSPEGEKMLADLVSSQLLSLTCSK
jgi:hypothetical protein